MLGKALGRRGILRGIAGAGVLGLGAARSPVSMNAGPPAIPSPSYGMGMQNSVNGPPDWLESLQEATYRDTSEIFNRPNVDGLDIDIAVMGSWSPSMKLTVQRQRQKAREAAARTLWDKLKIAHKGWQRSLTKAVGL